MDESRVRPIVWMGSSLSDVRGFPTAVRQSLGYALFVAQRGGKSDAAKPLKGIVKGGGILEIVEDRAGNAFRAVYAVKIGGRLYVLHAFQKKSPKGKKMTLRDLKLIKARYEAARTHAERES